MKKFLLSENYVNGECHGRRVVQTQWSPKWNIRVCSPAVVDTQPLPTDGNGQWPGLAVNHAPPSSADVFDAYSASFTSLPGRTVRQLPGAVKQGRVYYKFYLRTTSCSVCVSPASPSVGPGLSLFWTPAVLTPVPSLRPCKSLKLCHDGLLRHPFQFLTYWNSRLSKSYILRSWHRR